MGGRCGLKPEEILDMSLDVFKVYIKGYSEHIHDQEALMIQAGYWSGYYMGAKHPKPPSTIIGMITKEGKDTSHNHSDEVDVEAFKEMERKFNERRNNFENK